MLITRCPQDAKKGEKKLLQVLIHLANAQTWHCWSNLDDKYIHHMMSFCFFMLILQKQGNITNLFFKLLPVWRISYVSFDLYVVFNVLVGSRQQFTLFFKSTTSNTLEKNMVSSELKDFLESSTIHGLVHISTARSKTVRVVWFAIVVACFAIAVHMIVDSYKEWQ